MTPHSVDFPTRGALPAHPVIEGAFCYHAGSAEDCISTLESTLQGLSDEEVLQRRKKQASTRDKSSAKAASRHIFLKSFKRYIFILFMAAAGLSLALGRVTDGLLILAAMLINGAVQGLIQCHALKAPSSLTEAQSIRCSVRRNGLTLTVDASELVVGDILLINGGQVMPADARLISSYQMQADESLLTGESVLVPKNANEVLHPMEDVSVQCNMLFAGTVVKTGKGEAIVVALGADTMMGRIAGLAHDTVKRESAFAGKLGALSLRIFLLTLLLTAVVVGVGYYQHRPILELVQLGIIMGIAAFPETIPGLVSLLMALGVNRLSAKKVRIKNFHALETVGDIRIVCTDKTGTLTENYLVFDRIFVPELGVIPYDPEWGETGGFPSRSVEEALRVGRLNNGTMVEGLRSPLMGDPIDVALYRAAPASLEIGYHPRISIPFDPVHLRSATLCEGSNGRVVSMIKGAPEAVMDICTDYMRPNGEIVPFTLAQRSEFLMFNRKLAYENNLRVIGFARKAMAEDDTTGPYANAVFLGWVCLMDPPKPGVHESISALRQAGAHLVMITGDQKATAEMTARELGIIHKSSDEVWLRSDLSNWEHEDIPDTVKVFARTRPEEKLAIVESLQRNAQVVAMVGDGVNDSPALQKSDVAIAMGLQGSEAAKNSADIILMNDRLEGILYAIEESRALRRKTQACIRYLLSCNLGLILFVAAASLLMPKLPVNIIQMLWLNLVVVSFPAMTLAVEPPRSEAEATDPAPLSDQSNLLDKRHTFLVSYWGLLIALTGVGAGLLAMLVLKRPPAESATAAFCTLAIAQTLNLFNVQALNAAESRRAFIRELTETPITWIVLGIALILQVFIVYTPGINALIGASPLSPVTLILPVALGGTMILLSLKTLERNPRSDIE